MLTWQQQSKETRWEFYREVKKTESIIGSFLFLNKQILNVLRGEIVSVSALAEAVIWKEKWGGDSQGQVHGWRNKILGSQTSQRPLCESLFFLVCTPLSRNAKIQLAQYCCWPALNLKVNRKEEGVKPWYLHRNNQHVSADNSGDNHPDKKQYWGFWRFTGWKEVNAILLIPF